MTRVRHIRRMPNWAIGLIAVIVIGIASVWAFTKEVPWGDPYEVRAVFRSAQNIRFDSPVRIAGVNVGEVTKVEPLDPSQAEGLVAQADGEQPPPGEVTGTAAQQAAVVTMEITDEGRPIKEDARFRLRPRLFLEGNLFVDTQPGSPGAAEVDDEHTFPMDQTSNSVQLDQILSGSLQSDSREDLQLLLEEFGIALIDAGGAKGFQEFYRTSAPANKFTSQVNEAILGNRPHDLSGLIKNLDRVVRGLGRNENQLKDLVTNLRIFTGSLAAEDANLEAAVARLPGVLDAADPAFANLNAAFPPLRAFAREALPGVRSSDETLEEALPLIRQLRLLSRRSELRGLARDLVPTIPKLARLSRDSRPFLEETRALASCFNQVIIPWSNDRISSTNPAYPHDAYGRVFEETGYGLVGIAGESRSGDANGQYIRVLGGGGTNTQQIVTVESETQGETAGVVPFELLGAMPGLGDSAKTPFRPNRPCENQEPPNLAAAGGPPPEQRAVTSSPRLRTTPEAEKILKTLVDAAQAREDGDEDEAEALQRKGERMFRNYEAERAR